MGRLVKIVMSLVVVSATTFSFAEAGGYYPENARVALALKVPGNLSVSYELRPVKLEDSYFNYEWRSDSKLPVIVFHKVEKMDNRTNLTVQLSAVQDVYFSYRQQIKTGYKHDDCQFYMPGFWYRRNLCSPKEAPSFHTSDSWLVREDRLNTPLTAVFNSTNGKSMSVIRIDKFDKEILATHQRRRSHCVRRNIHRLYRI